MAGKSPVVMLAIVGGAVLATAAVAAYPAAVWLGNKMYDQNPEEPGLIGRTVLPRGWVARKPSDIYWNGIRELEIYNGKCSFSEDISGELAYCASRDKGLGNKRS